jgi:N-acetylglutamate synthase-like GNAT family acetyltransferase
MQKDTFSFKNVSDAILIVEYQSKYANDFKKLNEAWITQWFKMEEADYLSLNHPQTYILDNGGHILIALHQDVAVGTCALIKKDHHTYELAKMSVATHMQGKGIGFILAKEIINKSILLGARRLYLESNSILESAINLYRKLGFQEIKGITSPYERCNLQMELMLASNHCS